MTAEKNFDPDRTNGHESVEDASEDIKQKDEARTDVAETPGTDKITREQEDELADEWGKESFPGSDPPAHY